MVPDIAKKGHSFNGALAYYLHDKGKNTDERVAWTETRNLMTDDPQAAKRIMIATALQSDELKKSAGIKASGRKSNAHVYAYALSWHPDEAGSLDKAQMMAAVESSLKELEADHLQSIIVCHTDQKHPHVHVVLNRVDPFDGRMHPFKNDRLKLSDWANKYERDRGQIVTPAREEKRKKREQHADKQKRQEYARKKKDQAKARDKSDLSPAAMLTDLSAAQKVRHRQDWRDLSADNKAKRGAIYDSYRQRIKDAAALHKQETKPFWRDHFKQERDRKKVFNDQETTVIGKVKNAMAATAYQHMQGEINGKGQLSATFSNVLSSQKRRSIFERRLDLDRRALGAELKAVLDEEVQFIKSQRKDALKAQRSAFDESRTALIQRHDEEWAKVREAWKQLRSRPNQRGADPVKKDWDKKAVADPQQPKPQPTRQATVAKPSPAPSPAGEVPRSTARRQTVPTGQNQQQVGPLNTKGGLSATPPAKKDWSKTGAAKPTISAPKDWSKKADRSQTRKAPTPSRDLDRSR